MRPGPDDGVPAFERQRLPRLPPVRVDGDADHEPQWPLPMRAHQRERIPSTANTTARSASNPRPNRSCCSALEARIAEQNMNVDQELIGSARPVEQHRQPPRWMRDDRSAPRARPSLCRAPTLPRHSANSEPPMIAFLTAGRSAEGRARRQRPRIVAGYCRVMAPQVPLRVRLRLRPPTLTAEQYFGFVAHPLLSFASMAECSSALPCTLRTRARQ